MQSKPPAAWGRFTIVYSVTLPSFDNVEPTIEYKRPSAIFLLCLWSAISPLERAPSFPSAPSLPYIRTLRWNSFIFSDSSQKDSRTGAFALAYLKTLRVITDSSFISNHSANHSNSSFKLYLPSNHLLTPSPITTLVHTPSWIISCLDNYNCL